VKKSNGSTGTLYWYMSPGIVAESDLSGNLTSEYVFFSGERVARRDGTNGSGGVFYYFSDHLKTTDIVTDAQGNIKNESDFYPWGGELQFLANDSNHYKFTGKERDSETGLDYFGARYYSNGLGRFITPDWAAKATAVPYAEFADPQSLNLYTYVRNVPTTRVDADGHFDDPFNTFGGGGDYSNIQSMAGWTYTTTTFANGTTQTIVHPTVGAVSAADLEQYRLDQMAQGPKDHFVTVSDWPTGAGGFHHTGIAVDDDETYGFSTKDPSTLGGSDFSGLQQQEWKTTSTTIPRAVRLHHILMYISRSRLRRLKRLKRKSPPERRMLDDTI
jgi:RHS repeat-associated protein